MPSHEQQRMPQVEQGSDSSYTPTEVDYNPTGGLSAYAALVGVGQTPEAGGDRPSFTAAQKKLAKNDEAGLYYEDFVTDAKATTRRLLLVEFFPRFAEFQAMSQACDAAANVERAELAAQADDHRSRVEKLTKLRSGLAEGKALIRGMSDLTAEEFKRIRDAAMDDSKLGAVEDWAAGVFGEQAEALAKKLYDLELARTKSESAAETLYTRLRPVPITPAAIDAATEAYRLTLSIPLGDGEQVIQAQTQYHISTRPPGNSRQGAPTQSVLDSESGKKSMSTRAVAWGKGGSGELTVVVQRFIDDDHEGLRTRLTKVYAEAIEGEKTEEEALALVGAEVEEFMGDENIGIDCSAFALSILGTDSQTRAGLEERFKGEPLETTRMDYLNVRTMAKNEHSEPIPVSAARPGDIVVNTSLSHVGLVGEKPEALAVAKAVEKYPQGTGLSKLNKKDKLYAVDVHHSQDANGQRGPDGPGPHAGTWFYSTKGTLLGNSDATGGPFHNFRRLRVTPSKTT